MGSGEQIGLYGTTLVGRNHETPSPVSQIHLLPCFCSSPQSLAILPMAQWSRDPNSSLSAYLFLGGNSSLSDGSTYSFVDLTGLPSAYNLTGNPPSPGLSGVSYQPPLTTVLVCDP